ncbi:FAD-binding oxidoreductase [Amycolatopsis anabasis]|uniref:FAD-binding oxidoreductase n=1 Tax=Amycolatopsis anabasis TaxID=1840409 RepID=UPI00131B4093|nr:FAD-binding oxidoreductase [Amycolatopsis anabasis]
MYTRRSFFRVGAGVAAATTLGGAGMFGYTSSASTTDWSKLRAQLAGTLVLPPDSGYLEAKRLISAEFDRVNPQAIAYCVSTEDVRRCVLFAREHGVPATPRSGGHSFNGWSTTPGLIIDTSKLNHAAVGSTVKFGPGLKGVDSIPALKAHGVTLPIGGCPTVSPGGFLLGGGLGWQTRKYGLAADRLVSARVVLADGRVVRASASQYGDLYWALRGGGGGNFGIVTEFESRPTVVDKVISYRVTWPWAKVTDVIAAWQPWLIAGPDELATTLVIVLPDAAPGAVPIVQVVGAYLGPKAEADAAINGLISAVGSPPATNAAEELPYDTAMMRAFGCGDKTVDQCHVVGQTPGALLGRTKFVAHRYRTFTGPIPAAGINPIVTAFDANRRAGQNRSLVFAGWGGQANRVPVTDTAWPHRDAEFAVGFSGEVTKADPTPDDTGSATAWANNGFAAMDPYSSGHTYLNYGHDGLPNWQWAYYGCNYDRLVTVKRKYDPDNFFSFSQSIGK